MGAVLGAAVYLRPQHGAGRHGSSPMRQEQARRRLRGDAALYANSATFGPLAWLMAQMYLVAWWASLLFDDPPLHDACRLPPLRRDARDVHADDRGTR